MATRNHIKLGLGVYAVLVFIIGCLFVGVAQAMTLAPDTAPQSVPLFELLAALVGGEAAAKWITIGGFAAWVLTQLMAWLPPEWVARLPTWLIRILKVMAGNYRKAANDVVNDPEQIRRTV